MGCTLKKALTIIKDFLNRNPKETVIVSYQKTNMSPYGCSKSFKSVLKGEVEKYLPAKRRRNGNVKKHIRLRSVRGKVILMDAKNHGRVPATAWLPYWSSWEVDNKWDDVTEIDVAQSVFYLKDFEIQHSYYNRLKRNVNNAIGFWRGAHYKSKTGFVTWMSANDCGKKWGTWLMPALVPTPYRIARKVNPTMRRHFNAKRARGVTNFGFVVMDYPDYSIIRDLVNSNFK